MALLVLVQQQMRTVSHALPMKVAVLDYAGDEGQERMVTGVAEGEPLPGERSPRAENTVLLVAAFSEFIAASGRLENSYRQLQHDLAAVQLELSAQNQALSQSLAQNKRMHLHLQQIVDSMPCGVLVLNAEGAISMINPESVRLLGVDCAALSKPGRLGLHDLSSLGGLNLRACYDDAARSGQATQEFCLRENAGNRWMEVRTRRLFPQNGETREAEQTIFILRDVTAQRRDEQERTSSRKAMALAEMTTILAHEIRNPLASLELFAELIENDPAHRAAWISNLRAGIRSLSATANNVLTFYGSGVLRLVPVSIATVVEQAVHFVQPLADQSAVGLQWLGAENQTVVLGNECALQQVVLNLVLNAIRHTPAGGTVTIALQVRRMDAVPGKRKATQEVVVEFADTGSGIPPDQWHHLFEPGFSGHGDTSGLGLAVCQQIMTQHHGRITVAPPHGGGARFELHFPILSLQVATA